MINIVKKFVVIRFKKCFTCKSTYPNFMFLKNNSTYQRPDDLGTCKNCRICTYKQLVDNYLWVRINSKFQKIEFKTFWDKLKFVLR